jgi:hypothetical protein
LQGQHLQEQDPAGFQSGNGQVKPECQPTNHAAEDSGKYRRSPVFSPQMRFLPTTICKKSGLQRGEHLRLNPQF